MDVGSSTSHLVFARLRVQRLAQSLSSRFAVAEREVLYRSSIFLTPYRSDGSIDPSRLDRFVLSAYRDAGLRPDDVDTGAVILTGTALERANAPSVADLFAATGGRFVCASAGHNLEAILAAHGSGTARASHRRRDTRLHVDVGGGTSKLSLVEDGDVLETAAVAVGGRLVILDRREHLIRVERAAATAGDSLGMRLRLGERLSARDRRILADRLASVLIEAAAGQSNSDVARGLMLTEPLSFAGGRHPRLVTFSGGVSEYIYGRESGDFGDIGRQLADSLQAAAAQGRLPAPIGHLDEGIRATVIGASQFTLQLSGNTIHLPDPSILPLRNLPVVHPRLPVPAQDSLTIGAAIETALRRLDLVDGDRALAVALDWRGDPHYATLRALAGGIARALPRSLGSVVPLVVAVPSDVGRTLGAILEEEFGAVALVTIDGLELGELDYVDVGDVIRPAGVLPVVIKTLAFPGQAPVTFSRLR
jgi:ethanolamine utilization protein EutA